MVAAASLWTPYPFCSHWLDPLGLQAPSPLARPQTHTRTHAELSFPILSTNPNKLLSFFPLSSLKAFFLPLQNHPF